MECIEEKVDMWNRNIEDAKENQRIATLLYKLNNTMPMSEEYNKILKEIFCDNIGENSHLVAPHLMVLP